MMKKIFFIMPMSLLAWSVSAQVKPKGPIKKTTPSTYKSAIAKPVSTVQTMMMKTKLDSASYAFGQAMAQNLKSGGLEKLNYDLLNKGMKDAFTDAKPLFNEQEGQRVINGIFESLAKVREERDKKKYEVNIKEGEDFLAKNKTKVGVQTTASGLQYEIITPGTGTNPLATDQVTVHYKGTLLNGIEFDSSYKRNEPTTFGLNQVIPGWTEGVQLMLEGAKYRFYIPYQLAYGARGAGQDIKPYSTLIFDIELIKVNKADK